MLKMMDEGRTLKHIRAEIEQKYSKYGPPTPTPPDVYVSMRFRQYAPRRVRPVHQTGLTHGNAPLYFSQFSGAHARD